MKLFFKLFFVLVLFNIIIFGIPILNMHVNVANAELPVENVSILGAPVNVNSVDGFVAVMVNVAKWILGICGSLALLAFVAGGAMLLASAGSSTLVERGKQTLVGAVIGLIIIFCSWITIKYVTESIGGTFNTSVTPAATTGANSDASANNAITLEKCNKKCNDDYSADGGLVLSACIDACSNNTVKATK